MTVSASAFVSVPGGYLYHETHGTGPDLVLLNAGAADLRMWSTTVARFSTSHRVTTFDYRDTGLSSPGTRPYSEAEDVAAVLDAVGTGPVTVVGCSDGGRRALGFALAHPDRVEHVVVVGATFGEFPEPTPEERVAREELHAHLANRQLTQERDGAHAAAAYDISAWGAALNDDDRRRMIAYQLANWHYVLLEESLGEDLDPPVKTRFAEIKTPMTVMVGDRDFASTRLWADQLVSLAPRARLEVLSGADHFPMLSRPSAFERCLRAVLTSVDDSSAVRRP